MSVDDLEKYEAEVELGLYKEYRDVLGMFRYVVETEKRFYLANEVKIAEKTDGPDTFFEVQLNDAWVWDMYRQNRFVASVRIMTFADLNVEELKPSGVPDSPEGLNA